MRKKAKLVHESLNEKRGEKADIRSRGECVFKHDHRRVKDNKDHFPINSVKQARNALARVNQYDKSPEWYDGSLQDLNDAVVRVVHKKYKSIDISKEAKNPKK